MLKSCLRGGAVLLLLLSGCASAAPASTPGFTGPSWFDANGVFKGGSPLVTGPSAGGAPTRSAGTTLPVIIPVPEVPQVAPPIEGSPSTREPFTYAPPPAMPQGQYGLPLNPGPNTGFGPGGLAQPPGARPNPPFHF